MFVVQIQQLIFYIKLILGLISPTVRYSRQLLQHWSYIVCAGHVSDIHAHQLG
jgi:hypothetical protein